MSLLKKCLSVSAAIMVLVSNIGFAHAIIILPELLILAPYVVRTSPTTHERVVTFGPNDVPVITVMFSEDVKPSSTSEATISLFNNTDSVDVPLSVSIHHNTLYATTGGLALGKQYTAIVHGSEIRRNGSSITMNSNYTWTFKTAASYFVPPAFTLSEPIPDLSVEQSALTSSVTFIGTSNSTAQYRVTLHNTGGYTLNDIVTKVVLPAGFAFDRLVGGAAVTVSGSRIVTFTLGSGLGTGTAPVSFDYQVTVSNEYVENGTYSNTAIVQASFIPSGAGIGNFDSPVVTGADDNRENDDDISVNRLVLTLPTDILPPILPTPTSTGTPTPTPIPTPTSTTIPTFDHPSSDPLTCLRLNGATSANFSDVPGSLHEAPYINFLNTTVFASTPDIRLSRGYSNGTFGTNNTLTRFELTKMALGANCINYATSTAPNSVFTDVPTDNSEMSLVIGKARALGIVQGVGNQFYPNRPVSYGEMVKILVGSGTYFDRGTPTLTLSHTLNGISDESFRQFAEYSARMNLVNLNAGNTFPQNDPVQRRFMAQAVARYIAWLKNISLL